MAASGNFTISTAFKTNDGATVPGPFLQAPGFDPTQSFPFRALQLFVPSVAGAGATQPACAINPSGANTDFTLKWQTMQGSGVVAVVDISPEHLYSPDQVPLLWSSFAAFREQLENLDPNCLMVGGAAVLANRIAQAMPLRYDALLLFQYNLNSKDRYVDLYPGMALAIEYGAYQYLGAPTVTARNAYTGTGVSRLRLRRRTDGTLGFCAFNDALRSVSMQFPSPIQIAGLLDLEAAGASAKYVRLIYPPQVDNVTVSIPGPSAARNPVLLFADTLAKMKQATDNYLKNGDPGTAGRALFFSGRVALYPEISIFVNGSPTLVPLGTTLADLVASNFTVSMVEIKPASFQVAMWRWVETSLFSPGSGFPYNYRQIQVTFDANTTVSASTGLTQWDIPLVSGDVIRFVVASS